MTFKFTDSFDIPALQLLEIISTPEFIEDTLDGTATWRDYHPITETNKYASTACSTVMKGNLIASVCCMLILF